MSLSPDSAVALLPNDTPLHGPLSAAFPQLNVSGLQAGETFQHLYPRRKGSWESESSGISQSRGNSLSVGRVLEARKWGKGQLSE